MLLKARPKEKLIDGFMSLSSRIITEEKSKDFIKKTLKKAKGFKLLYRATDNDFSAQKFHDSCDYKPDTLVVVRTIRGSVLAGYTPLQWAHPK